MQVMLEDYKKNKYKNGITLIALIITLLIILIISISVITILTKNNSIENAEKTKFLNNLQSYETQLEQYINTQELNDIRQYDSTKLNADATSIMYDQTVDTSHNISDIISSFKDSDSINSYKIQNGKLVYIGQNEQKMSWINQNINNSNVSSDNSKNNQLQNIIVNISNPSISTIKTNITEKYTLDISSRIDISILDIQPNLEIKDKNNNKQNVSVQIQEDISNKDDLKHKSYVIIVDTNTLSSGEFNLVLRKGAIKDIKNNQNEETASKTTFKIQKQTNLPEPEISIDNEKITNQVIVSIYTNKYGSTILYSINDKSNWQIYTQPFVITKNTTIYAKIVYQDFASDIVSKKIENIDNILPEVVVGNPSKNFINSLTDEVTYLISCYDLNLDKININNNDYIQLEKTNTADADYEISKVQNSNNKYLIRLYNISGNGKINIDIKKGFLVDLAKNKSNEVKSLTINVDNSTLNSPAISSDKTYWTNQDDVIVITYPTRSISNLYSLDGINWNKYTGSVKVKDNITIYAKAEDTFQNTSFSTYIVSNIDKQKPTVILDKNSDTYQDSVNINISLNDELSGIDYSSCGYVIDTQNKVIPQNGWNKFNSNHNIVLNNAGDWYIWIKVIDNAGNKYIYVSDAYKIQKNEGIIIKNPNNIYVKSWNSVEYVVTYDLSKYKNVVLDNSYINMNKSNTAKCDINVYSTGENIRVIRLSNFVGDGNIEFNILRNSAKNINGSGITEINGFSKLVVDNTSPNINVIGPDTNIVNNMGTVKYEVNFEDLNLDKIDLTADNLQVYKTGVIGYNTKVYGDNDIKYIEFTNITGNGNVSFTIPYGIAKDKAGNVSNYYSNIKEFEVDNTKPVVSISKPNLSVANNKSNVVYDVYATDKNLSKFNIIQNDIILYKSSSNINADINIKDTSDIGHKQIILDNISGNGNIAIAIKNNVASDKANNLSEATDLSNMVEVDNVVPEVKISGPDIFYANSSNIVKYTVKYSDDNFKEAMLNVQNIVLNKTNDANASIYVYQNGSNSEYVVMLYNITGNGKLSITIPDKTGIDKAGNYSDKIITSNDVIIDNISPNIKVSVNKTTAYTSDNIIFTVEYKDENFDISNLNIYNIIVNKYIGMVYYELNIINDKNIQYIEFNNISGEGSLSISIPYGIAKDKASNVTSYYGPSQNVKIIKSVNANNINLNMNLISNNIIGKNIDLNSDNLWINTVKKLL